MDPAISAQSVLKSMSKQVRTPLFSGQTAFWILVIMHVGFVIIIQLRVCLLLVLSGSMLVRAEATMMILLPGDHPRARKQPNRSNILEKF